MIASPGGTRVLPHDLVGQFILCRSEAHIPRGWRVRRHGAWSLASHPTLPVIDVVMSNGAWQGWLLGYPITSAGRLLLAGDRLSCPIGDGDAPAAFERSLYALGGRYVAIFFGGGRSRVYLDPYGVLATIFCPAQSIVASTPSLVPHSAETPEHHTSIAALSMPDRDGWFPFGLTGRPGVERLHPNHALDLMTWETVRHWPTGGQFHPTADPASVVAEMAAILENQVAAVARAYPIQMSLTAGRHTRMLLSCARAWLPRIVFFTIPVPDGDGDLDNEVARRIAHRFGLNYLRLKWEEPTANELRAWQYRVGGCVGGRVWRTVRTLRQLYPERAILSAMCAEIGVSLWHPEDHERSQVSAAMLVERLKFAALPEMVDRAERWLAGVPAGDIFQTMDLLHLEQRFTSWAGTQEYGNTKGVFDMTAFSHRRLIELQFSLPREYRRRERLPRDLITMRWPQLLRFPFNHHVGLKGCLEEAERKWRAATQRLPGAFARPKTPPA